METLFKIGLITKPQGIKGELKVNPLTDDIERFSSLKKVLIDGKEYKVLSAKIGGGVVFITLSGVQDRNSAETFRGKFLCVERKDAVKLPENRYFVADIEGSNLVLDSGEVVGTIVEVTTARTDIFTVKTVDNRVLRFPFLKDLLVSVDVENKIVTVNEKRLKEVSLYED